MLQTAMAFHKVQKQNCENEIIFCINSTKLKFANTEMLKLFFKKERIVAIQSNQTMLNKIMQIKQYEIITVDSRKMQHCVKVLEQKGGTRM